MLFKYYKLSENIAQTADEDNVNESMRCVSIFSLLSRDTRNLKRNSHDIYITSSYRRHIELCDVTVSKHMQVKQ